MKSALITGASSGIGQSIAQYFSKKGWKTLLVGRDQARLEKVKDLCPLSSFFVCDLTQMKDVGSLIPWVLEKQGPAPLKALVNNAGIFKPNTLAQQEGNPWQEHFESNLMSAVRLTSKLWPYLKQNKTSIVNISSTLALRPIARTSAYSALKAAMNSWTLSLALEGGPLGIRANAICPGIVDTPIHKFHNSSMNEDQVFKEKLQKEQPLGRIGQPQDVAPLVFQLCQSQSSWITGTLIPIDGGILLNSSPP